MRFEEAYSGWTERRLTQEDAAQLLGVCARTFRRYIDRYEDAGLDGLLDKRLSQVSHRQLGIEMIPAYSPEARGRSERAFGTHPGRLPQELAAAGITDMDAANAYLRDVYLLAFNAEFAHPAREDGSAFVPCPSSVIPCSTPYRACPCGCKQGGRLCASGRNGRSARTTACV